MLSRKQVRNPGWVWALVAMLGAAVGVARADTVVFSQPPNAAGGQYKSAWYDPEGMNSDEYAYDSFTLAAGAAITQVRWRGAYTNYLSGAGAAPVYDFTIDLYRSSVGGTQPDLGAGGRLARYHVNSNAGETPAGSAGGVAMYDYVFTLPAPFQAAAGATYWVQIEASQGLTPTYYWPPDWSMARGTGGNNSHFRHITDGPYQFITGDLAFSLYASSAPTVTITASVSPAGAGAVVGAGAYPVNSTVTLDAAANAGWAFVNWTQNGSTVSTNPHYTFPAAADRTLVANFSAAYTVTTASYPLYGGSTSGGGVFASGSVATLVATPAPGFVFEGWSDGGATPTHPVTVDADLWVTAFFASAPGCATFDFDAGPSHTSLPLAWTVHGLTATFSATNGGFSVQPVGTVGLSPPGFSGLMLYPNSVFAADLVADFSQPLVEFSILYSPQELGCDDSATMRATAYLAGVQVATATTTVPVPGTYPSGTLRIAVTTGFDRVVVHYDARPVRCQDWGPIFFADNVTVTRQCVAPGVQSQPVGQRVCPGSSFVASVSASGSGALGYQWEVEAAPGVWTPLGDGAIPGLGLVSGAASPVLVVDGVEGGASVHCVVIGDCGGVTTDAAVLGVKTPDYNQDGNADQDDVSYLINIIGGGPNDTGIDPDLNADGNVDQDDVAALIGWIAGSPCS